MDEIMAVLLVIDEKYDLNIDWAPVLSIIVE